jgi:Ca2+-transporting ATPase
VSALVFQAERPTAFVMTRPPRNPAAPLLPRGAVLRSGLSGGFLALVAFAAYWSLWDVTGEAQARAVSLIVLMAGYQTLLFAERLALPDVAAGSIPRTRTFWFVWCAAALSLLVILSVPSVAQLFWVARPTGAQALVGAAAGIAAVGWRLIPLASRARTRFWTTSSA